MSLDDRHQRIEELLDRHKIQIAIDFGKLAGKPGSVSAMSRDPG
jgi:hypothetical protein